jgi:hypothetical protein
LSHLLEPPEQLPLFWHCVSDCEQVPGQSPSPKHVMELFHTQTLSPDGTGAGSVTGARVGVGPVSQQASFPQQSTGHSQTPPQTSLAWQTPSPQPGFSFLRSSVAWAFPRKKS